MAAHDAISYSGVPLTSLDEYEEDCSDLEDAQAISGKHIDPRKLAMLLRIKFGAGTYDIHVGDNNLALKKNECI
jgi:hypothetical protein